MAQPCCSQAAEQHATLQEVPSLSSSAGSGQHSDPVWQVRWIDRGLEQEERLVTISTDGRVTQWATTKVTQTCLQTWNLRIGVHQYKT